MTIEFDDASAAALSTAADNVAEVLLAQAPARSDAAEQALTDFSGSYVPIFNAACNAERDDRAKLAGVLSDLSIHVGEAKALAKKELDRLKALAEWQTREDNREQQRKLDPTGIAQLDSGVHDPKPSEDKVAPPTISASFSPVQRGRTPGFGRFGTSVSAIPENLRGFATTSRSLTQALDPQLLTLGNAWASFIGSCGWVEFGDTSFIGGFTRFIGENLADASWAERIADAFEKAGSGTLETMMLMVLSGATIDPKIKKLLDGSLTPEQVAKAWQELMDDPSGKYDARELLVTYADILGKLDGMPAMARVEANRNYVPSLLKAAQSDLDAELAGDADPEVIKFLEHEIKYLNEVASGNVQLYLYDRNDSRIIEMIGTPGPDTIRAVTYVPGTYTGMDSFFTGGVQQVSQNLVNNLSGTVAFIYKDGLFPGETHGKSVDANLLRITEANDQADTLEAGKQLAGFETGMRTDPSLKSVEQVSIGHSWGLANVVSSEEADARYDKVISLAGAGMPKDWMPKDGTDYSNLFYYDVLIHAQTKKLVWKGNNPIYSDDFVQYYYHDDRLKGKYINTGEDFDVLMDNHNRITRDSTDNQKALEDLRELVGR